MNFLSNRSNRGLSKGKFKDTKDVDLSPPSTPSSRKENLSRIPSLKESPPPNEEPRRSIGTPTSVVTFEHLSGSGLSSSSLPSSSLPSIEDTGDYITTSARHLIERSRQGVIRDIIASEESYVAKLLKIRDAFINPLLHHPFANTSSTTMPGHDGNSTVESLGHLAIASRLFYSPTAGSGDNKNDNGRARTTSHASRWRGQGNLNSDVEHDPHKPLASWTPADSLSPLFPHRSPRLPPHPNHSAVSTAPLGFRSSVEPSSGGVSPHQMPEDLWLCLEGIEGILTDHLKLGEALRKRYNEQYPTVRSLVDILLGNLHALRGYTGYVLHLERALEQANDAIVTNTSTSNKRPNNEWLKFCVLVQELEIDAQDNSCAGLAISLSEPFHHLLQFSELFEALLLYTGRGMLDYEGTVQLVAETENIVRGIKDAKTRKEDRNKIRDILARIKGLEKVKQFVVSKPSRVLVGEKMLTPRGSSDVLQSGRGSTDNRRDVWLVVFNDVVLRCQRTGIISLPLGAAHSSGANSLSELQLQGNSKYSHRNSTTRPRNLYKFIKIERATGNVNKLSEEVVSMEDMVRSRAQVCSAVRHRFVPIPEDDQDRSDHSYDFDRDQEMTLSHWNTDNARPQKPLAKSQPGPVGHSSRQNDSPPLSLYPGSSLANARFGSRLVSANSLLSGSRPPSHLTVTTPSRSDDGCSAKAFTRLGLGEHGGQIEPTASLLYSESSGNANSGEGHSERMASESPALSEDSVAACYRWQMENH